MCHTAEVHTKRHATMSLLGFTCEKVPSGTGHLLLLALHTPLYSGTLLHSATSAQPSEMYTLRVA